MAATKESSEWFTVPQLARWLKVSRQVLYKWNHEGTGPAYSKVGSMVRYRRSDVEAWLKARRVEAS